MLERLANVIYWTTSTIALLMIPFLAWGWYVGPERERPTVLFGAGIAVGIWLIGQCWRGSDRARDRAFWSLPG